MALFGIPLWLFLLVFAIVMILVGVLLWYLEKLL
jgi:cytoskeletal protein RodZ